jgi:hypothetical protein
MLQRILKLNKLNVLGARTHKGLKQDSQNRLMFTNAWRGGTVFFNNNYIFVHYLGPVNFNNKYNKGNAKRGISPRLKI